MDKNEEKPMREFLLQKNSPNKLTETKDMEKQKPGLNDLG